MRFGIFVVCSFLIACVGDDSNTGDAGPDADLTGTLGHACFGDNGCIGNLVCQLSVHICVSPDVDASSDAPTEANASDGGADGEAGCQSPPFQDLTLPCASEPACTDGANFKGCANADDAGTYSCPQDAGTELVIQCDGQGDCPMSVCCTATMSITPTCPRNTTIPSNFATWCQPSCPTTEAQVCVTSADCPPMTNCVDTILDYNNHSSLHFGTCE